MQRRDGVQIPTAGKDSESNVEDVGVRIWDQSERRGPGDATGPVDEVVTVIEGDGA